MNVAEFAVFQVFQGLRSQYHLTNSNLCLLSVCITGFRLAVSRIQGSGIMHQSLVPGFGQLKNITFMMISSPSIASSKGLRDH